MCRSGYCYIANERATISMTDAKQYILVVTLSTQHNTKLLQKLKSDLK